MEKLYKLLQTANLIFVPGSLVRKSKKELAALLEAGEPEFDKDLAREWRIDVEAIRLGLASSWFLDGCKVALYLTLAYGIYSKAITFN